MNLRCANQTTPLGGKSRCYLTWPRGINVVVVVAGAATREAEKMVPPRPGAAGRFVLLGVRCALGDASHFSRPLPTATTRARRVFLLVLTERSGQRLKARRPRRGSALTFRMFFNIREIFRLVVRCKHNLTASGNMRERGRPRTSARRSSLRDLWARIAMFFHSADFDIWLTRSRRASRPSFLFQRWLERKISNVFREIFKDFFNIRSF